MFPLDDNFVFGDNFFFLDDIFFFAEGNKKKYSAKKKNYSATNEVTHAKETPLYLWYDVFVPPPATFFEQKSDINITQTQLYGSIKT